MAKREEKEEVKLGRENKQSEEKLVRKKAMMGIVHEKENKNVVFIVTA